MVEENYLGDEFDYIEETVRGLPFGTKLTQPTIEPKKNRVKSIS